MVAKKDVEQQEDLVRRLLGDCWMTPEYIDDLLSHGVYMRLVLLSDARGIRAPIAGRLSSMVDHLSPGTLPPGWCERMEESFLPFYIELIEGKAEMLMLHISDVEAEEMCALLSSDIMQKKSEVFSHVNVKLGEMGASIGAKLGAMIQIELSAKYRSGV